MKRGTVHDLILVTQDERIGRYAESGFLAVLEG